MENEDPYTFECMKLHVTPKSTQKNKKKRLSKTSIQNARCTINSLQTSSRSETVQLSLNTVVKRHMAYTRVKYPFLLPSQIKGHTLKELGLPNCMGDISFSFGSKKSLCKAPWTKNLSVNSLAIFNFSQLLRNFLATALEHQNQSCAGRKSSISLQNISQASLDIFEVSNRDTGSNSLYAEKRPSGATQRMKRPPCDLTSDDSLSNRNVTSSPELAEDLSVVSDSSQLSASHIAASRLLQQKLNITQCKTITVDKEIIFDKFESSTKQLLFNSPSVISLAEDENDYVRTLKGFLSVQESPAAIKNEERINAEESDIHYEKCSNVASVTSVSTLIAPWRVRESDIDDEKYSDVSSVTSDSMPIAPWRVKSPAIQKLKTIVADLTSLCTDPFDVLKFSGGLNSSGCNIFEKLSMTETISISEHSVERLSETDNEMSSDDNGRESPTKQVLSINDEEHTEAEDTDLDTGPLQQSEILGVNEDSSSSEITSIVSLVHSPDKSGVPNGETSVAHSNTPSSPTSSIEEDMSECHSDLGYNPSLSSISSVIQVLQKGTPKEADMKSQSKFDSSRNLDVLNLRETPATPTNAVDKIISTDIQGSFKSQPSPEKQIQPSTLIKINQEVSSDSKLSEECENTAVEIQDDMVTGAPQVLVSAREITSDEMQSDVSNFTAIENINRDSPITTSTPENSETNSDWESDAWLESTDVQDIIVPQNSNFSKIQKSTVQLERTQKKAYKVSIGINNKKAKKQKISEGVSKEKMSQILDSNIKNQKDPTCKKSLDGEFYFNRRAVQNGNINQASALETNESINIKASEGTPMINQSLQSSAGNEQCENEEIICDVVTSKSVAPTQGKKNIQAKVSDALYIAELSPKQRTPLAELGVVTPETSHQQALFKTPTTRYRTRFKSRISEGDKAKQTIFTAAVLKKPLLNTPSPIQTSSKSLDLSDYEDGSSSEISDTHSLGQESITSDLAESLVSNVTGQISISEISEKSYLNKIANTKFAKIVSTPNLKRKSKDNTGNDELIATSTQKKMRITNSKNSGKKQVCFQGDDTSVKSEETDVDSLAKTRVCRISNISKTDHAQQRTTVSQSPTIDPLNLPQVDPNMSVKSEETDVDSLAKTRVRRISKVSRTGYAQQRATVLQSPTIDPSNLPQLDPNLKVSKYLSGMIGGSSQDSSYLSSLDSSDNETPRLNRSLVAASECSTTSFLVNMFDPLHPQKIQTKGNKKNQTNKAPKKGKAI